MVYRINGTDLSLQPSSGRWRPQEAIGIDGNGHPIYPATHEFEISWGAVSIEDAKQIYDFFDSIGATGSAVVELPKYKASSYMFFAYSGCVLHEPEVGDYFAEHYMGLTVLVSNIRV